ncbi:hypothetical protein TWF730_008256 [Orbilia blumenaviensis]|uniref:Uncharacterized protein n=1 Tax=Orbilia blumenaviensis TaxID=1796055 RepID=A0AAV9V5N8_9PEZI
MVDENLLTVNGTSKPKKVVKKKKEVADSWDDEVSSGDEATGNVASDLNPPMASPAPPPAPPAPTPAVATPFGAADSSSGSYYSYDPDTHSRAGGGYSDSGFEGQRQAKTDAVARRMIASALGVRSRSTKEQREYDASLKKKHQEEREEQKRQEQEKEKAKAAIWDD